MTLFKQAMALSKQAMRVGGVVRYMPIFMLCLALLASACGRRGKLYLPPSESASGSPVSLAASAPPAPHTD